MDFVRSTSVTSRRTFLSWLSKSGLVLAAAGTTVAGRTDEAAADQRDVLVFTNATLIDGTGAPARPNTTIVVAGNRILAVGNPGIEPPAGVRVVDLRGKYVLPGLWDMHTHTVDLEQLLLPLYIANGVTAVRETWGVPYVRGVRERIASGELLGPRMVVASNIVDGPVSWLDNMWGSISPSKVRTAAEARAAVRQAKQDGADFVKVYSLLDHDTLTAVADEAQRLGLPIAGHVPDRLSVLSPGAAAMRTQEHLYALYVDVSRARDDIRNIIRNTPIDPANPVGYLFAMRELERQAIKSYDPRRAAEVFAGLQRNGTALTLTLTVLRLFTSTPEMIRNVAYEKYMPKWVRDLRWAPALGPTPPPDVIEANRAFFEASARMVRDATDAGVTMVTGTDGGFLAPYILGGFCMHDELELMVRVGLSPMQAILAATRDAARVVDMQHVSGTVTPGKFADLLVVDGNPLTDIRNTRRIHAVVANGRLINRAERERMLAKVEADAKRIPPPAAAATWSSGSCCAQVPVRTTYKAST
nr:amidohydrolase family protein [Kibdelosporangium sp. MJ126-NF4]CEL22418.1 amidohydrolase [Kibdelosporangium sp. MJ126-NF4]CTQ89273.1 amidohydrolase [Kibdelosporangium sp. MJ126-NF4]